MFPTISQHAVTWEGHFEQCGTAHSLRSCEIREAFVQLCVCVDIHIHNKMSTVGTCMLCSLHQICQ